MYSELKWIFEEKKKSWKKVWREISRSLLFSWENICKFRELRMIAQQHNVLLPDQAYPKGAARTKEDLCSQNTSSKRFLGSPEKASKLLFESFVNISPSKADDMSDLPQSKCFQKYLSEYKNFFLDKSHM